MPVPGKGKWSIPTAYGGIRFRSKLEAGWAEFFDRHRIEWAYEPEGFAFEGVCYLPDFYLPEIKTIVEVKGVLDAADNKKLSSIAPVAAKNGVMIILAQAPAGECFSLVEPSPQRQDEQFGYDKANIELVRCAKCRSWYFLDTEMAWACLACGYYDGDASFDTIHPRVGGGFYAGDCPDCGRKACL